eukprot:CAMPEP_0116151196 /NCGR_PEP_ID=MMETSP0329-20121206/19963_1 /TAXON_ID=697910 /ORGANISM="Pseudo-nitzschia arenysensis, Strain B593" /LENGTH=1593 /DNA_ID=CAMNT_0003647783 /DNA_START=104 /DNA_END=4885 /DNA_ORIENTATION=+
MESYPGELLVGVCPLIFCVDATLEKKEERNRTDKFLDTISITSSMVDGGDDDMHEKGPMMQKVEGEQSDMEDDILLKSDAGGMPEYALRRRSSGVTGESSSGSAPSSPTRHKGKSRGSKSPFSKRIIAQKLGKKSNAATVATAGIKVTPSFAEALKQGQSFFQRARIVSSSARHGFPPSKDPTGKSNRVISITGMKHGQLPPQKFPTPLQERKHMKQAVSRMKSATQARPIDGILPSGWLEKHAAALPSVIVVVTQVHHPDGAIQQNQDKLLLEALENLQHSLAPKRKVEIKLVAVIQDGVSPIMADQWCQEISQKLPSFLQGDLIHSESILTVVEERELRSIDEKDVLPPSINNPRASPLPNLHQSVRLASRRYYKNRAKENKGKILRLRGPKRVTNRSPVLMPLLIRYYFKAAVFYEFQWKPDKALKYMVEAYRLVESYYNYLLFWKDQREGGSIGDFRSDEDQQSEEMNLTDATKEELQLPVLESSEELGVGEGVEMSLPGTASISSSSSMGDDFFGGERPPAVPDDMIHQCRSIADWLNFKILQMCMVSHDKSGTIAASKQWQRHAKTFCCPRRSFLNTAAAPWLDWSFVAQQRVVVSQLLERYPPRALGELGGNSGDLYDEDLLRCCSWRTYEAAAEALLKAGHRIRSVVEKGGLLSLPFAGKGTQEGANRIRYVGCIDHEGFGPSFAEESQKPHTEKALNCALRGISLYEKELEKLESTKNLFPWSRSGARLYYLVGGALMALNRHSEAIPHLEKACELCEGWSYMESLTQRLLVECYEHQGDGEIVGTVNDEDGSRTAKTSSLIETYFNAGLSSDDLASKLEKLVGMSGIDMGGGDGGDDRFLRWHYEFLDDDVGGNPNTPFSFAVSFPLSTHGSAGDKVKAIVWVRSNLQYAVQVNRMAMMSLFGPLPVSFDSGSTSAITIQPNEAIKFQTELALPVDLVESSVDGAGNITSTKPVTSKPKSGGFTAAGGSRYAAAKEDEAKQPVAWSIRCLGGKTLRCEGIILTFSVVSSAARNTCVKLAIEGKQPDAPPNTKRTNFDENNYVCSAWKRPPSLAVSTGPRSLRILSPIASMLVTNVTEEVTNGKVLEGTVNRVVLKLKAADYENCDNVVIRAASSSALTTDDGKEKSIALPTEEGNSEEVEDMMNPRVRAPVLVKPDPSSKTFMTDFGYILPSGWVLASDDNEEDDGYDIVVPTIKAGEEIYASFDVYRPTPEPVKVYTKGNETVVEEMTKLNDCKCETEINVSIRYNREIIDENTSESGENAPKNSVSFDHSVNVLWSSPMSVGFSSNAKVAYPSGNQHSSNIVRDDASTGGDEKGLILIDGGNVFTKGILEPSASADVLNIEIDKVQFTDTESDNTNCEFRLLGGLDDAGTILQANPNDPCRTLQPGSKMSFAWMTQVSMDMYYREETLTAPIGTVSIYWKPSPVTLSEEVPFVEKDVFAGRHGPLQLDQSAVCHYSGPVCQIESAPFEVIPEKLPNSIKFASPFEVTYCIRNKTPVDQEFEMTLQDSPASGDESPKSGFLIGGNVVKTSSLGPFESQSFTYTSVPTKIGRIHLPSISISSKRYKTWIIRESLERRPIFVQP